MKNLRRRGVASQAGNGGIGLNLEISVFVSAGRHGWRHRQVLTDAMRRVWGSDFNRRRDGRRDGRDMLGSDRCQVE